MSGTRTVVTHVASGDLWAGAEVQVYNLCKALKEAGVIQPTAVVFNPGILKDRLEHLGIPVTLADERTLGPTAMIKMIASHCRQHQTDVLHTHGFKENVLGVTAKLIAGVPRSVRTVHGNPETVLSIRRPHKWAVQKLDIWLGRLFQDRIIAVSSQLETALERLFPHKVCRIHNFVDVEAIREHRQATEPDAPIPVIGLVGRLVPVKRADLFLRALAILKQRNVPCRGEIIGTGPLQQELESLAHQLELDDRISFRGFVHPVLPALASLQLLAMPSDHEGLPMTLLEALALEVPIVAHQVGGIPDVLAGGRAGWLVADHSAEGYADALQAALQQPDLRHDKARAGLNHARATFGATAALPLYHSIYELQRTTNNAKNTHAV